MAGSRSAPDAIQRDQAIMTDLYTGDHACRSARLTVDRTLGRGRGATARLVTVRYESGDTASFIEKVFRPGFLTSLVYWLSFQSPFAYR